MSTIGGSGSPRLHRRLAAVMGVDVKGYSLLMGRDEEDTHERIGAALTAAITQIERSEGRLFSFSGDGLMAEFPSSVQALRSALRIQAAAARSNRGVADARRIDFRIGINMGDVVDQGGRIGGDAVNIAARLEQIAEPGSIYLSRSVLDQVARAVRANYLFLGERQLKNIMHSVAVYRVSAAARRGPGKMAVPVPATDYRPSLAVLPFSTLQSDHGDEYFASGMVDDIIHSLGGLRDLLVITRASTYNFTQPEPDPRRLGEVLGVRYVLQGSVRRSGGQLRIAAELWETETAQVLWVERFDGTDADLFALQDRISIRVVTTIAPQVRERELRKALRKYPSNMTAYDLVLQAMDLFYRMDRDPFERAYELLHAAIEHDPGYAPAWSNLAYWHVTRVGQGWSPDAALDTDRAANAASTAIQLDSYDAQAMAISGHMQSYLLRNYEKARELLSRALVAGPNCALAWSLSSLTSGFIDDSVAAIAEAEHALRLSPMAPDLYWHQTVLAQAYYIGRRYQEAVTLGLKAFDSNRSHMGMMRLLIAALVAVDDLPRAQRVAERLLEVLPNFKLTEFQARTPLRGVMLEEFVTRLRAAGLSD